MREAEAAAAHRAYAGWKWTGVTRLSVLIAVALIALALIALALIVLVGGAPSLGASTTTTEPTTTTVPLQSAAAPSWTVYHGDPTGSGVAASITAVDVSSRAWTSPALDGQLYGEPLVSGGRVFVATENDTVDALSATTGAEVWSTHLATPVPSGSLPCGNISPTVGITGTPVVDEARGELFVVADQLVHGRPAHQLVGLSTATGRVELNQNVDPSGSTPAALLQRTGLTLDAGRVVFGYGGNYGDCSTYHGWVLSVPEAGGKPATFGVDSALGESQGAVWMGGAAPVVDASGNIWVTVGNGSVYSSSHAYDHSDSVLELSPSLTLLQYFAPSSWPSDNAHDLDMSTAPALLSDGQVVAAGKSRIVYLLNGSRLGGIGGQQAQLGDACGERHRRWRRRRGLDRLPALPERAGRRAGIGLPRPAPSALELLGRGRAADRRRGARLDHRCRRRPLRPQPVVRHGPEAGEHRCGRQPLPHPVRRSRPAAGDVGGPRRGLPGVVSSRGQHHDDHDRADDNGGGTAGTAGLHQSLGHRRGHFGRPRRRRWSDLAPATATDASTRNQ